MVACSCVLRCFQGEVAWRIAVCSWSRGGSARAPRAGNHGGRQVPEQGIYRKTKLFMKICMCIYIYGRPNRQCRGQHGTCTAACGLSFVNMMNLFWLLLLLFFRWFELVRCHGFHCVFVCCARRSFPCCVSRPSEHPCGPAATATKHAITNTHTNTQANFFMQAFPLFEKSLQSFNRNVSRRHRECRLQQNPSIFLVTTFFRKPPLPPFYCFPRRPTRRRTAGSSPSVPSGYGGRPTPWKGERQDARAQQGSPLPSGGVLLGAQRRRGRWAARRGPSSAGG